ncbi:hypothetical protein niasHT_006722 [Heterodera trifolii]|uniref:Succinate--CoA ligase [ADP-forming] subunit beta, mitochondrial n=1 Tax=Heterodera trifolii TaxID=157864 RepID=A0ABD2LWW8_9BILA
MMNIISEEWEAHDKLNMSIIRLNPPAFQSLVLNPPTFQSPGLNPPAFQALGLNPPAFQSLGLNSPTFQSPGLNPPAFQALGLNSPKFQSLGLNPPAFQLLGLNPPAFQSLGLNPPAFQALGLNSPTFQSLGPTHQHSNHWDSIPAFQLLGLNPPAFQSLGLNPPAFQSLGLNPPAFQALGLNSPTFQSLVLNPPAFQSLGLNPPTFQSLGLNPPAFQSLGLNTSISITGTQYQHFNYWDSTHQHFNYWDSTHQHFNHWDSTHQHFNHWDSTHQHFKHWDLIHQHFNHWYSTHQHSNRRDSTHQHFNHWDSTHQHFKHWDLIHQHFNHWDSTHQHFNHWDSTHQHLNHWDSTHQHFKHWDLIHQHFNHWYSTHQHSNHWDSIPAFQLLGLNPPAFQLLGLNPPAFQALGLNSPTFQSLVLNPPAFQALGLNSPTFQSLVLNPPTFQSPGLNPPAFQSLGLNPPAFQSLGLNPPAFQSLGLNPPAFQALGLNSPTFQSLVLNPPTFQSPGLNPPAFQSLVLNPPAFQSLGLNPPAFQSLGLNPPAFQLLGLNPPAFQALGLNSPTFQSLVLNPPTFQSPGLNPPAFQSLGLNSSALLARPLRGLVLGPSAPHPRIFWPKVLARPLRGLVLGPSAPSPPPTIFCANPPSFNHWDSTHQHSNHWDSIHHIQVTGLNLINPSATQLPGLSSPTFQSPELNLSKFSSIFLFGDILCCSQNKMNFLGRSSTSLATTSICGLNRLCRATQIRNLNLQEYQSKSLLRKSGCTVQNFFLIEQNEKQTDDQFQNTEYAEYVVKAQILAGGRGKGHFIGCPKNEGGIRITRSVEKAKSYTEGMLGKRLVTKQTGDEGVVVKKVMVAESITIRRETYLSVLMDPTSAGPVVVACPLGGVDIEEVAATQPVLILKERISVFDGITEGQCQKIAQFLGFSGKTAAKAADQIRRLYELFIKVDASQIEINPFVETNDGKVFCVDAKLNFDDNASFRQSDIFALETFEEMDPREMMAKKCGLSYVGLDGNIACMVNGAGLAMATMDIIKLHGGEPANFLDLGGGATVQQVREAFNIVMSDASKLRVIFVNVFCGILRCDVVAQGILDATADRELDIPVVIRLKGNRMAEAKQLIDGAPKTAIFECFDSFEEAAKRAVQISRENEAELDKPGEKSAYGT